jgi:hypothetical protein
MPVNHPELQFESLKFSKRASTIWHQQLTGEQESMLKTLRSYLQRRFPCTTDRYSLSQVGSGKCERYNRVAEWLFGDLWVPARGNYQILFAVGDHAISHWCGIPAGR